MTGPSLKISIIIPVYNGSDFLNEAVDSAISQNYPNKEIIIVNDGSDDFGATEKIAREYGDSIIYYCKDNGGVASALNFGINHASGDYISWLSHDDVYLPGKISKQVEFLQRLKNPESAIIYSDWFVGDSGLNIIYANILDGIYSRNPVLAVLNHKIHGCDLLIPKKCFEECAFFDEALKSVQDYDLWFKFVRKYEFRRLPEFTIISRLHERQGSRHISTHEESRNALHIKFLDELSAQEILVFEKNLYRFYLKRAFGLKKEGLLAASDYAMTLAKELKEKGARSSKFGTLLKKAYSLIYSGSGSAALYFFKLFLNPFRWNLLFKIIRGRLNCAPGEKNHG